MTRTIIPIFISIIFIIAFILSPVFRKEKDTTIYFGNITGSGYPLDYVRAHPDEFPMSDLPESQESREKFLSSLRNGQPKTDLPPGTWGGGGSGSMDTGYWVIRSDQLPTSEPDVIYITGWGAIVPSSVEYGTADGSNGEYSACIQRVEHSYPGMSGIYYDYEACSN